MLTLAIETSGKSAMIALAQNGNILAERSLTDTGRRHAQTLVAEIGSLLNDFQVSIHDCDLFAVSIGPGSFTGLRVGLVSAKTFAYVTGAKLAAVDTFEAIAANSPTDVEKVFVVGDAQRGGLFVGFYCRQPTGIWQREGNIAIVEASQWSQARAASDVITGAGIERLPTPLDGRCRVLERECWTPSASTIARIGLRLAERDQLADCMTLEPFYLRRSAAEEKAEST